MVFQRLKVSSVQAIEVAHVVPFLTVYSVIFYNVGSKIVGAICLGMTDATFAAENRKEKDRAAGAERRYLSDARPYDRSFGAGPDRRRTDGGKRALEECLRRLREGCRITHFRRRP